MEYIIHLAILICIYLIFAQALNVSFGLGGLLNLAHVSAYAIGAYTTALLATNMEKGFLLCIAASMALAGFFSLLIGLISLKLRHDYFAIGTLAFASIVSAILINWKDLTRGVLGIPGIPRPDFWGIDFYDNSNFLVLAAFLVVLSYLALAAVFFGSPARVMRAQAEDEVATASLSLNVRGIKNNSFIISSAFAGLSGSLFAYYINYIDPSSFGMPEMVFVLSIVVVGRPGSFWGVTLATVFLVLLPEPLRFISFSPAVIGPMRQLLYGLILLAVTYWQRDKLFPVKREI